MKWIYYQHKPLHGSAHEAVRSMTTLLFFLEIPYTLQLLQAVPIHLVRIVLMVCWLLLGFCLFLAYHIMTETNTSRRTQFVIWTASAGLNVPLAAVPLVWITVQDFASLFQGNTSLILLPTGYFGAKAVMSAYLAMRAWNFMEEERLERERAGALLAAQQEGGPSCDVVSSAK